MYIFFVFFFFFFFLGGVESVFSRTWNSNKIKAKLSDHFVFRLISLIHLVCEKLKMLMFSLCRVPTTNRTTIFQHRTFCVHIHSSLSLSFSFFFNVRQLICEVFIKDFKNYNIKLKKL